MTPASCMFCGSTDVGVEWLNEEDCCVLCGDCSARGPIANEPRGASESQLEAVAVQLWNEGAPSRRSA